MALNMFSTSPHLSESGLNRVECTVLCSTNLITKQVLDADTPFVPFDQVLSYTFVMLGEVAHSALTTPGFNTMDVQFVHIIFNVLASLLLLNLVRLSNSLNILLREHFRIEPFT